MSPLVIALGLLLGGVAVAAWPGGWVAVCRGGPRNPGAAAGPGWTPRMEYTATSFAEPLTRVFDDVLRPEQDVDVTPYTESRYLIESVQYRQRVPDRLEARLYPPVLAAAQWWGQWSRRLAERQRAPLPGLRVRRAARRPDRGRDQRMTGSDLTVGSAVAVAAQLVLVVGGAPLLVGVMRQVRARLEGRAGAGVGPAVARPAQAAGQGGDPPVRHLLGVHRRAPGAAPRRCSSPRSHRSCPRCPRWTGSRTCSRWSRCCCWAPSRWPWPAWTPAPRSAGWAPAGR